MTSARWRPRSADSSATVVPRTEEGPASDERSLAAPERRQQRYRSGELAPAVPSRRWSQNIPTTVSANRELLEGRYSGGAGSEDHNQCLWPVDVCSRKAIGRVAVFLLNRWPDSFNILVIWGPVLGTGSLSSARGTMR